MANHSQKNNRKAFRAEARNFRGKKCKMPKGYDAPFRGRTQTAQSGHAGSRPGSK